MADQNERSNISTVAVHLKNALIKGELSGEPTKFDMLKYLAAKRVRLKRKEVKRHN